MGSSHGKFSGSRDGSVEGTRTSHLNTFMEKEKKENHSTRRQNPNQGFNRRVPRDPEDDGERILDIMDGLIDVEGELVAAGWPKWLVEVAGEALNGWLPRGEHTFDMIGKIGQGTYSNVYKARDRLHNNNIVALKRVRFDYLDPESVKFMAREIIMLRRLGDHPNVIKLKGLVTSNMSSSLYLVFDCMEYDLKGIQEQKDFKFSEPEIKCYMNQLLKGLNHCHSRGILHRDVTTSNLLVNKEGNLKIADFGLSTFFDPEQSIPLTSKIVTLWYRPPELLLGSNSYGIGVDLWGVGCVLGELFTGKPIMPGKTEVDQLHKIFKLCGSPSDDFWQKYKFPAIFKPRMPYIRQIQRTFPDLPASVVGLMDTLLSIEPECRGTASLALQGAFFTTEPFACDPSSLPQCPPSKEIDARKTEIKGSRFRKYALDRRDDQRTIRKPTHYDHDMKGKKKWSGSSDKMLDLSTKYEATIVKTAMRARLEKGSTAKGNDYDSKGKTNCSLGPSTSTNDQISTLLPAKWNSVTDLVEDHKAQILKDAQCVMSDKEKMAVGEDNNSKVEKNQLEQLLHPEETDDLDNLEDNQYYGLLSSASKSIDVDRILREHDRHIQEFVERAKQQKKLGKARY